MFLDCTCTKELNKKIFLIDISLKLYISHENSQNDVLKSLVTHLWALYKSIKIEWNFQRIEKIKIYLWKRIGSSKVDKNYS